MFKYENRSGAGCYGTVFAHEEDKVVKLGKVSADIDFHEIVSSLNLSIFPKYYGTIEARYQERRWGSGLIERAEGVGLVTERLKYTLADVVGLGLLPFNEVIEKMEYLESQLKELYNATYDPEEGEGIALDDLHAGNIMFDEKFNIKIVDVGCWFMASDICDVELHAWYDINEDNYNNEDFYKSFQKYKTRAR